MTWTFLCDEMAGRVLKHQYIWNRIVMCIAASDRMSIMFQKQKNRSMKHIGSVFFALRLYSSKSIFGYGSNP